MCPTSGRTRRRQAERVGKGAAAADRCRWPLWCVWCGARSVDRVAGDERAKKVLFADGDDDGPRLAGGGGGGARPCPGTIGRPTSRGRAPFAPPSRARHRRECPRRHLAVASARRQRIRAAPERADVVHAPPPTVALAVVVRSRSAYRLLGFLYHNESPRRLNSPLLSFFRLLLLFFYSL